MGLTAYYICDADDKKVHMTPLNFRSLKIMLSINL